MKLYQTILILFITLSLSAQVDVYPTSYDLHVQTDSALHDFVFTVINKSTKTAEVFWMIEPGGDWPAEWKLTTCDINLCYAPNMFKCPNTKPNELLPGDTMKLKISLNSYETKGINSLTLRLFSMPDCEGEFFVSEPGVIQVGATTDIYDVEDTKKIYVYPNPTQDYLEIYNDDEITSINLFDHSGKVYYTSSHVTGQIHDLHQIPSGIFILKMKKTNGEIISDQVVKVGSN
jgi:hypothetical protein